MSSAMHAPDFDSSAISTAWCRQGKHKQLDAPLKETWPQNRVAQQALARVKSDTTSSNHHDRRKVGPDSLALRLAHLGGAGVAQTFRVLLCVSSALGGEGVLSYCYRLHAVFSVSMARNRNRNRRKSSGDARAAAAGAGGGTAKAATPKRTPSSKKASVPGTAPARRGKNGSWVKVDNEVALASARKKTPAASRLGKSAKKSSKKSKAKKPVPPPEASSSDEDMPDTMEGERPVARKKKGRAASKVTEDDLDAVRTPPLCCTVCSVSPCARLRTVTCPRT